MGIISRLKNRIAYAVNPEKDVDNNRFADIYGYKAVWVEKELPSPRAMNFAYESLALAPESPISGAVAQRQQLSHFSAGQLYQFQTAWMDGIPTISGNIIGQPLYDPQSGYVTLPRYEHTSDLVAANIVADRVGPRPTNAPFPTNS
jgi:hypothetical protein